MRDRHDPPVSSYRVQLHAGFRFAEARALVPYLDMLGITDFYASPYVKANPGSTHGYDICDHTQLNPELGTDADYDAFCATLEDRGLGHILDFVPNHMACDARSNPWWRDVLENGPSSPYARFFDIDWDPLKPELKSKVLLPILGDQYGRVLESGGLQLQFDEGALHLVYGSHDLPINPRQAHRVLQLNVDGLERDLGSAPDLREYLSVLTALQNLPSHTERDPRRIVERQREKEVARERLARLVAVAPPIATHIQTCVRLVNGVAGDAASFDRLHELLEHQAYRLAYWRTAFDEINYRRFFDINDLVGLRMEEPDVFDAAHQLLERLIASGGVTGLRIDHPDGLFDPAAYFGRLQALARRARPGAVRDDRPFYVVAEKILSKTEALSPDWPVDGTTGYHFLNAVAGLFIDGRQASRLRRNYMQLTGRTESFDEVAYQSKRTIMLTALASELNVLANALNRISERDRRARDFTLITLRRALREVVACFPVYRTYVSARGGSAFDQEAIESAIGEARRRSPLMAASIWDFLREMMLPAGPPVAGDEAAAERLRFAMKVQQFTSPVQAKGVEDTAFYRYHVLIAANDVGGHPGRLGVTAAEFHELNRQRLADWPRGLITTATHDTKRGEDARLRIAAISEMAEEWRRSVAEWMRGNARHRVKVSGHWAPDRNDEYLFYQALAGVWPAEVAHAQVPPRAPADLVARLSAYLQKAAREAKVHTSWIDENAAYGQAVAHFTEQVLTGRTAHRFLESFLPVQRTLARLGMIHSLAQCVLKTASPGVTDVYQGTEFWDLSLVDPDNRRPIDFNRRCAALTAMRPLFDRIDRGRAIDADLARLFARWPDGDIKLFVLAAALRVRRRHAALMLNGGYVPIDVDGPEADHVVAFARTDPTGALLVVVPRLVASLTSTAHPLPLGEDVWGTTRVMLPASLPAGPYRHLFTGETASAPARGGYARLSVARLFRSCPVAMCWADA